MLHLTTRRPIRLILRLHLVHLDQFPLLERKHLDFGIAPWLISNVKLILTRLEFGPSTICLKISPCATTISSDIGLLTNNLLFLSARQPLSDSLRAFLYILRIEYTLLGMVSFGQSRKVEV